MFFMDNPAVEIWASQAMFKLNSLNLIFPLDWFPWAWANDFPQESHLKSLWPSWMILMCPLRWPAWVNDFPQESHYGASYFHEQFSYVNSMYYQTEKLFGKYCIDVLSQNYEQYWNASLSHHCSWTLFHKFHTCIALLLKYFPIFSK